MSWRALLTDRIPVPGLKPLSLSWDAIGGPQQALLSLENDLIGFESMRSWLGSGVEIYDPSDRLAWWGYVDRVGQPLGVSGLESSLEDLANRVAVRYRSMEPGKDFGAIAQTEWKDDLTSQAIYGVKELLLMRDLMSREQALQLRDMSLHRMALPVSKILPSTKIKQSQCSAVAGSSACAGGNGRHIPTFWVILPTSRVFSCWEQRLRRRAWHNLLRFQTL